MQRVWSTYLEPGASRGGGLIEGREVGHTVPIADLPFFHSAFPTLFLRRSCSSFRSSHCSSIACRWISSKFKVVARPSLTKKNNLHVQFRSQSRPGSVDAHSTYSVTPSTRHMLSDMNLSDRTVAPFPSLHANGLLVSSPLYISTASPFSQMAAQYPSA
jgi:hypothetical protein